MGASACMTGRPYVYALSAYGEPGVARLLSLLRRETERAMALLGCSSVDELSREQLRLADRLPAFLANRATPETDLALSHRSRS
jgi:L-lactate dehydrogenase (cytochrome)